MSLVHTQEHGDQIELIIECELTHRDIHVLREEIDQALESSGEKRVVLNLAHVSIIDSTGMGFMVNLWKDLKAAGRDMVLQNLSESVRNTLKLAHIDMLISDE